MMCTTGYCDSYGVLFESLLSRGEDSTSAGGLLFIEVFGLDVRSFFC